MSRIGKAPISMVDGVEVTLSNDVVTVKGPKGELTQWVDPIIKVDIADGEINLSRGSDHRDHRAKHGLYRALIANMIEGVSKGYEKKLEFVGVGYRAKMSGQILEMMLGFSHPIHFEIPSEVKATAVTEKGKNPMVILESHDKDLIGKVAAKIRSLRKPEPYKGKGVRYFGEEIRRKAGKTVAS